MSPIYETDITWRELPLLLIQPRSAEILNGPASVVPRCFTSPLADYARPAVGKQ